MDDLLALSVRQPWAHAIVHLGKDLENRSRSLGHRGLLLIHASAVVTRQEYDAARLFMLDQGLPAHQLPTLSALKVGGIVGAVEVTDCVAESDSPWWMGPRALVLRSARPLPFMPCKGTVAPLFWRPPADIVERARSLL